LFNGKSGRISGVAQIRRKHVRGCAAPALAAKHAKAAKIKMTGACAQQSGRCISDCD